MKTGTITFHSQSSRFGFSDEEATESWLRTVLDTFNKNIGTLSFVFMDDDALLELNRKYLEHDDFTDVITFDWSEEDHVAGDICISWERVEDNAKTFGDSFERELRRVIVHGVLHLLGRKDKSDQEKREMRKEEEKLLNLYRKEEGST